MSDKTSFPQNRLGQLTAVPGGMSDDEAVSAACANVRALAPEGVRELADHISAIEQILLRASGKLTPEALAQVQNCAGQIVCLATTFGHELLDLRARRLCDAIERLPRGASVDAGFVTAHIQAMRLLTPRRG